MYWLLVVGHWLLVIGCWSLVASSLFEPKLIIFYPAEGSTRSITQQIINHKPSNSHFEKKGGKFSLKKRTKIGYTISP